MDGAEFALSETSGMVRSLLDKLGGNWRARSDVLSGVDSQMSCDVSRSLETFAGLLARGAGGELDAIL